MEGAKHATEVVGDGKWKTFLCLKSLVQICLRNMSGSCHTVGWQAYEPKTEAEASQDIEIANPLSKQRNVDDPLKATR